MQIVALIGLLHMGRRLAGINLYKPLRILADCIIYHRIDYRKFKKSPTRRLNGIVETIFTERFLGQTRRRELFGFDFCEFRAPFCETCLIPATVRERKMIDFCNHFELRALEL